MIKRLGSMLVLAGILALGFPIFATAQQLAADDGEEKGSVIVFPKFTRGTLTKDNQKWPMTEIEIGAQCPEGDTCQGDEAVKVRFNWVCPGSNDIDAKYVCKSAGFEISIPLNNKVSLNPEDPGVLGENRAASAPCPNGYLIGWVINSATNRPIKYDALSGAATLRDGEGRIERYQGIAIRAEPNLASGGEISTDPDPRTGAPALVFDGAAGHYQALGTTIPSNMEFHKLPGPLSSDQAFLLLMTLDVRLNRPNYPTFVDLDFRSDENVRASTSRSFTCWAEMRNPNIDAYFTLVGTPTGSGIVLSGRAMKVPFGGISDIPGPVSLLGLVPTGEGRRNRSMDPAYIIQRFDKVRLGRAARSADPADVANWSAGKPTSVFVP
jgi:hypothetical protein